MITVDLNLALSVIAVSVALIGLLVTLRRLTMAEGGRLEELKNVRKRLDSLEAKEETLRKCSEETSAELKGLSVDMAWVKKTLEEIKEMVQK